MERDHRLYRTLLVLILGMAVTGSVLALTLSSPDDYDFYGPIIDTKAIISERFAEEVDQKSMQTAAIRGMLDTLDDPYTFYVPPTDAGDFTKDLMGEYVGIGVQIEVRDGWVTVMTPLDGSPAIDAGVMADDRFVEIEGQSAAGFTLEEAADLLQGEPGTEVSFVLERGGQRIPVTMKREKIVTQTVTGVERTGKDAAWSYWLDPEKKIAYIRVSQFNMTTDVEIRAAIESMIGAGSRPAGLILDFRGDPGGLLSQAVGVADMFLGSGEIVRTRGRSYEEQVMRATPGEVVPGAALAVLIDGQSASASEIVTGALVDNKRAVAVGTRTFGKGSVQNVYHLDNGGQLKVTEQKYYLPSGRSIHRMPDSTEWGVDPSPGFYVPVTDDQRGEMILARRQRDVIRAGQGRDGGTGWADPAWIEKEASDPQLAAALEAVQIRLETGAWQPTGGEAPRSTELLAGELQRAERTRERILLSLSTLDERIGELEKMTAHEEKAPDPDLWPDQVDVADGRLRVYDRDGTLVRTLRITGPDLERWLIGAGVELEEDTTPEPSSAGSAG